MAIEHEEDFRQLAKEAGLPTTEDDFNTEFEALRDQAELTVSNSSAFGPFWRFVNAVATTPAKWLVDFIINFVLPQAFLKTATGVFLELHAGAVNVFRKLAAKASGQVQFSRAATVGELTVPTGTVIQSTAINGQVFSLITTAEVIFADGSVTVIAPVEAVETGAAYNLAAGYYTILPQPPAGVTGVTNLTDWLVKPGADTELDDELRERVRNQYTAINQWHTDAVYTAIIAGFEGVTTNNVYFQHDAPRGPGTANAYVMLEAGNPSAGFIASIQSEITDNGNHGHGDDLQVIAMPETTHTVICTVWPQDNLTAQDKAALLANVKAFIRCAFRENTSYDTTKVQPYSLFSFSQLSRELHAQFAHLKNVDFNVSAINSALDIPRLGSLTVAEYA